MLFRSTSYTTEKIMRNSTDKEIDVPSVPLFAAPSMCLYAGKKCANARSFTRNGELHAFCYYHRVLVKRRRSSRQWPQKSTDAALRTGVNAPRANQFNAPPSPNSFVRFMMPGDCEANEIDVHQPTKRTRESSCAGQRADLLTPTTEHGSTSSWLLFPTQIQV